MTWIESHASLARHPKTLRLARALTASLPTTIGHLHLLWWWASEYAQTGDLSPFGADEVAQACVWEGDPHTLWDALTCAGFVDPDGMLHDWNTYFGRLLERRTANAEKAKRWRDRQRTITSPSPVTEANGYVTVTYPSRTAATVPNQTKPNQPPIPPPPRLTPDAKAPVVPLAPALAVHPAPKPSEEPDHHALWDAFTEVFGKARGRTEEQRRGEACRRGREAHATPDEIRAAAAHWPNVMGDASMSELAIVANLGKLLHGPQVNGRSKGVVHGGKPAAGPEANRAAELFEQLAQEQGYGFDADPAGSGLGLQQIVAGLPGEFLGYGQRPRAKDVTPRSVGGASVD